MLYVLKQLLNIPVVCATCDNLHNTCIQSSDILVTSELTEKTHHTANAGIRSKKTGQNFHPSNNKMERLNGEIRDREKVFRGLKKMDTPVLDGMRVYYNYTKKHGALKGQTPAESAKIEVDGKNKWKTIIQNASLHKDNSI